MKYQYLERYINTDIAIYGLGTETERFINECGNELHIIGLLDGFRDTGSMFGYPIIPAEQAVERVSIILVIARPGSCRAIAKRIGQLCKDTNTELLDIRGENLLEERKTAFDFSGIDADFDLAEKVNEADFISFDLFDTLVMRKFWTREDMFECVESRLKEKGIKIPDFAKRRLKAEQNLSRGHSPLLKEVYKKLVVEIPDKDEEKSNSIHLNSVKSEEMAGILAETEFETDRMSLVPRKSVVRLFNYLIAAGRNVYIVSDTYYTYEQIMMILEDAGIGKCSGIFLSDQYDTMKTSDLFDIYKSHVIAGNESSRKETFLHIGDDDTADIASAERHGMMTHHVYSAAELFERLGGMGLTENVRSYSDRVRTGLFISQIFNDPYPITKSYVSDIINNKANDKKAYNYIKIDTSDKLSYLFAAPIISDFVQWFISETKKQHATNVLLAARDGYLIRKLLEMTSPEISARYFYTSRISAIRAGVTDEEDIAYVDSMKFSGTIEQNMKARFGIAIDENDKRKAGDRSESLTGYTDRILKQATILRENYRKYISHLNLREGPAVLFDFVAKGTSQMFIQKMMPEHHLTGCYFLQLEPEFMKDKNLDIEPFISEKEKNDCSIFEDYYILETILTSPEPSVAEFDNSGNPIFDSETRPQKDIECSMKMQDGILRYFRDYLTLVPEKERSINKLLTMETLKIIHNVKIEAEDFLNLKVEDPFFNRWTKMEDEI